MHRVATLAVLLLLPTLCHAEQVTTWNFQTGDIASQLTYANSLKLKRLPEGLNVTATAPGSIKGTLAPEFRFDVFSITYTAPRDLNPAIIWNDPATPGDEFLLAPIVLPASDTPSTFRFDLNRYNEWRRRSDRVGIAFTEGEAVTIQSIQFTGYDFLENVREAWLTFWTLDRIRPSAINFLIGPQLTFTPVAREQLHHHSPPFSEYASWVIYAVMGTVVTVAILLTIGKRSKVEGRRSKAVVWTVFAVIATLWILYDLRMGAEFFGYVARDYRTYWSQPLGERTFRERKFFYDFAEIVRQFLAGEPKYAFVGNEDWPYIGILKYATFPSAPVKPEDADGTVRIWAVYDRPDVHVNAKGQLEDRDGVLSPPGKILHEFADGIFLFTTEI